MRKRIQAFPCKRSLSTIAHRHIRVFAWSLTANQIYSVINRCEDNKIPRVFPINKSSSIGTWRCNLYCSDRLSAFSSVTEALGLWLQDSITISTKHIDRRFNFLISNHFLFPKMALNTIFPIFLSNPALEVGIPVSRANFCLACVIPSARFKENDTPGILNFDIN